MIGNGNSVSKYDFVRHFFKMSYIAREGSKNYQKKKAVAMSNTYPKLFPLYEFEAQLFELYQMTGDGMGEKLPSKPTFKQ